jgi:hypothetical protein
MIITTCLLTHTQFRILVHGYLYVLSLCLPQSNDVLQIFKHVEYLPLMKCQWWLVLCYCKRTMFKVSSKYHKSIYKCVCVTSRWFGRIIYNMYTLFKKVKLYCKICRISMAPCWSIATHHILTSSIRDTIVLVFVEILNVICIKKTPHK